MTLVILGEPGTGKGTQATQLCQQLDMTNISTGDGLRQAITTPQTLPILDYYDYHKRLLQINGEQSIDQVANDITQLRG